MDNQFTNVRFESKSKAKMINEIKHELRTTKISSVVNDNDNSLIYKDDNNQWIVKNFKSKDKDIKDLSIKYIKELDNIENKHRVLLRKNFNQSLNKKRTNSANTGVLTFSSNIEKLVEEDKNKIIELGYKTIDNICKELDIELYYITFHLDEKGLPHFHYLTDNFNSKGKTISPKRNKLIGEQLQDLGNKYFNELGFKRGVSKKISGKKHLTIKEYQDYQDTQKENEELKQLNKELLEGILPLVDTFIELGINYKNKTPQEVIKLFERYIGTNKLNGLIKSLEKLTLKSNIDNNQKIKLSEILQSFKDKNKISKSGTTTNPKN